MPNDRDRYKTYFDHVNHALLVVDPLSGRILECNPKACQMLMYTREELLATSVSEVCSGETDVVSSFVRAVICDGHALLDKLHCRVRNGVAIPALISGSRVPHEAGDAILVSILDISHRVAAEAYQNYRLNLESTLSQVSADLLRVNDISETVAAIDHALEMIGQAIGACKGYLLQLVEATDKLEISNTWSSGECTETHASAIFSNLKCSAISAHFEGGEMLRMGRESHLLHRCPELKDYMDQTQACVVVHLPIFCDSKLKGIVGFDYVPGGEKNLEADSGVLHTFSGILGSMLTRMEYAQRNRAHAWYLEGLDRVSAILSGQQFSNTLLARLSRVIQEIFQADRTWLLEPCDPEAEHFSVRVETHAEGIPGIFPDGRKAPVDAEIQYIMRNTLASDHPFVSHVEDRDIPPEITPRFNAQSQMTIAVYPHQGAPWILGLHQCRNHRDWTSEETALFKTIAERVGVALSGSQVMEDLRLSEQRLTEAEHTANLGYWNLELESGLAYWSEEIRRIAGVEDIESVGVDFFSSIVHPDDWVWLETSILATIQKGVVHEAEYRVRRPDGEERWIYSKAYRQSNANGTPVRLSGIAMDITDRRNAEEHSHRLAQALEHAGEAILITDRDGIIEYANSAYFQLTGFTVPEVLDCPYELLTGALSDPDLHDGMGYTLGKRAIWRGRIRGVASDGNLYPAMVTVAPVEDGHGQIVNYISTQQDISEYVLLEQEFFQAQKMQALGTMVGGIAHDLNNVLSVILGNLHRVQKRVNLTSELSQSIESIERSGKRAADMIRNLLLFARKSDTKKTSITLTPLIKEIVKLARATVPEDIRMDVDISGENMVIQAEPAQLQQMMMNLISNAMHSLDGRDEPYIRVSALCAEDRLGNEDNADDARPVAEISVEDNGCGIEADQLPKVIEPFYTTKSQGEGSGLGLAMVFGTMKDHGGRVDISSTVGCGTVVKLLFPLTDKPVEQENEAPAGLSRGNGETILVVDDEPDICSLTAELVEDMGYEVITTTDPLEALELFKQKQDDVALLLTDLVMPRMSGVELAGLIRQSTPDLPVLFMSGYDRDREFEDLAGDENSGVLNKPVDLNRLFEMIRKKLDQ